MSVLLIAHLVIVALISLRIFLRDDLSPPARLAWVVLLSILPYVGGALYFLFGEVDLGRKAVKARTVITEQLRQKLDNEAGGSDPVAELIDHPYRAPFSYAVSVNGFRPVGGNTAELMPDAATTRQRMIQDIDASTDHVHVLYYIWLEDGMGTDLAQALIRAARRGVICRAMADGMGSRQLIRSGLWQRMREAGVQLAVALPIDRIVRTLLTSRIDLRNHRKITVIDGMVTYCGSRNSADPEFLPKARYGPWVDIMVRLTGDVASQNQALFATDWAYATGEVLRLPTDRAHAPDHGVVAQAVGFGPTLRRGATPQLFATIIGSAQKSVTLSTPYFVPDATVHAALSAAALRGIRVILIFPRKNDSWIVAAASRSYYRTLLQAGCEIHEFREGLLHAKSLTVDNSISMIGSTNLDLRSFDLNFENNILLQDPSITKAIRDRQTDYLCRSDAVMLRDVTGWSYRTRIWNNLIATIGPIL